MANPPKVDALTTLRGIIAANATKARLFGQGETLAALDAALVEIAQRQRTIANAVCVIENRMNGMLPCGREFNDDNSVTVSLPQPIFTEELRERLRRIFEAGDIV